MNKILLFAGTTEGRKLTEFLAGQPVQVTVCVATDYGQELLPHADTITILAGRKTEEEICSLLQSEGFELVIDATHPYAVLASENIKNACKTTGVKYIRLRREMQAPENDFVCVSDAREAASFLDQTEGAILLTTGSKDLEQYTAIRDYEERVYARVLPMEESLALCRKAGLKPSHILAVQGPFSQEMNRSMLEHVSARWMVTKEAGQAGGFGEKLEAARQAGVRTVVIGRPLQEEGLSYCETAALLMQQYGCLCRPKVTVVGIGPGSRESMTAEVRSALDRADCLIGAGRMLESNVRPGQTVCTAIAPADIAEFIRSHPAQSHAVVMSGDTGFFSGTKKLLPLLDGCEVRVLPGLSSLVCLCARLGISHEDVVSVSLHGRDGNLEREVRSHRKVFVLVGGRDGMASVCRRLLEAGLGHVRMHIGERLSYPDEKLTEGTARELAEGCYDPLSVALIINDTPDCVVTHGLPDDAFLRGEGEHGVVPMTKQEIRAVALSKLALTEHAVCWDIGAGTGSVSIEMALQARNGQVYGIEYKEEAVQLLKENARRFGVRNLTAVSGRAPEACRDLPAPTHVFIGGSTGSLKEVFHMAVEKRPNVRIVATAATLETLTQLQELRSDPAVSASDVVCIQASRDRKAGPYHLMNGMNPIWIFTLQAGENAR